MAVEQVVPTMAFTITKSSCYGRVDLKTEQAFCCCCCHLKQSAFELSEIRRGQEI